MSEFLQVNPRIREFVELPLSELVAYIDFLRDAIENGSFNTVMLLELELAQAAYLARN